MPGSLFPTTRRSVVEALSSEDRIERERAFDSVAAIYWKPLYKYARIVHRRDSADAEDLTQQIMLQALKRDTLAAYDSQRASFRTFLRTIFDRLIANEDKRAACIKRGGAATQVDFSVAEEELARENENHDTPDEYFRRQWVRTLFGTAAAQCRETLDPLSFAIFEAYDLAPESDVSYAQLARRHAVTEMTVTNRLAAARRRFREIALELVRESTASDREFENEVRALFGIDV